MAQASSNQASPDDQPSAVGSTDDSPSGAAESGAAESDAGPESASRGGPSSVGADEGSAPGKIASALIPLAVQALGGSLSQSEEAITVKWGGLGEEALASDDASTAERRLSAPPEDWKWPSELLESLLAAASENGWNHTTPLDQPDRLHEFSASLLAPYSAKNGHVHLGGCALDWVPLWRFVFVSEGPEAELTTVFTTANGDRVGPDVIKEAGLDAMSVMDSPPTRDVAPPEFGGEGETLLKTVVWCCWASGKVVAEIDEQSLTVEFDGWAKAIANGSRELPPFRSDGSAATSYRAELDDEGDIGPSEAIEVCCQSGRRLLQTKMLRCPAAGRWALPEHFSDCPVTGVSLLATELVECNMCFQAVSPGVLRSGRCQVCQNLAPVNQDDARLARLIGEFPRLSRWSSWKIGESEQAYILTAGALVRRLLGVVRKEPLELIRLATGMRWIGGWSEVTDEFQRRMENDR